MPAQPDTVIDHFGGEYRLLSNFSSDPVTYRGAWFRTAEHAFQATKSTDPDWSQRIADAAIPEEAKRLGRSLQLPMRGDWERIKQQVMLDVVRAKFTPGSDLAARLTGTGDRLLVEGNTWGDDYWGRIRRRGTQTLVGRNVLGRTLTRVRGELSGDPATRWRRVAVTGHREQFFDPITRSWVRDELARLAVKLRDEHGTVIAFTGMATGVDTWWAQAAEAAGLVVWAYQPFPGQTARFTLAQQHEHVRIRGRAERVVVVGERPARACYGLRDGLMIDDAEAVIAVRDPRISSGGTVAALARYCPGRTVIKVNPATRETTLTTAYIHGPWPHPGHAPRPVETPPAPGQEHTPSDAAASPDRAAAASRDALAAAFPGDVGPEPTPVYPETPASPPPSSSADPGTGP
ncbi:NADAR family protein [Nocardia wallacei]|uniref:NADAR family protein n=1 Tax=Nocardia wallacei TaxID=480035 RepID=UPI00245565C2|nr:NADAR family protein [Nocardia wallacei]